MAADGLGLLGPTLQNLQYACTNSLLCASKALRPRAITSKRCNRKLRNDGATVQNKSRTVPQYSVTPQMFVIGGEPSAARQLVSKKEKKKIERV